MSTATAAIRGNTFVQTANYQHQAFTETQTLTFCSKHSVFSVICNDSDVYYEALVLLSAIVDVLMVKVRPLSPQWPQYE